MKVVHFPIERNAAVVVVQFALVHNKMPDRQAKDIRAAASSARPRRLRQVRTSVLID